MINPATVMIVRPSKKGDPTEYTYGWGQKAVEMAKNLGYNVIDIQKNDATYNNVSNQIKKYHPRLFLSFSHGCPSSLQGQDECTITRGYTIDQLICMAESPNILERQKLIKLLNPLGELSCPGICRLAPEDPCAPTCTYDTNIDLLRGSIVYAVACHSAAQLGKCAINYGVETYIGFDDLLMFPVDSLNSQDLFGEVQLTMIRELLLGHSPQEANITMSNLEDYYIRRFKKIKYISLPFLWDKIHRKILGDPNARIYE